MGNSPYFIKIIKLFFYREDIESLKQKLISGEWEKLNKRANKGQAQRLFIPKEYITNPSDFGLLNSIINFVQKNSISTPTALFLLSLNLLKKEKLFLKINIKNLVKKQKTFLKSQRMQIHKFKKKSILGFWRLKTMTLKPPFLFYWIVLFPNKGIF